MLNRFFALAAAAALLSASIAFADDIVAPTLPDSIGIADGPVIDGPTPDCGPFVDCRDVPPGQLFCDETECRVIGDIPPTDIVYTIENL